jgi:hypothetical protein
LYINLVYDYSACKGATDWWIKNLFVFLLFVYTTETIFFSERQQTNKKYRFLFFFLFFKNTWKMLRFNRFIYFRLHWNRICVVSECHLVLHKETRMNVWRKILKFECFSIPKIDWLIDFWCLTPHSTIFQLYHSDQF